LQNLFRTEDTGEVFDFKSWVASGKYIIRDVPDRKTIVIEANNEYVFRSMMAYDICRTATASFETMENFWENENLPKSYGWLAIKCYYAAFFSANSIMRCFGYMCSHLERGHVQLLNDYSEAVGLPSNIKIESGYFCGHHTSGDRLLTLKKMNSSTHEETWFWLVKCLEDISRKVLSVKGVTSKIQSFSAEIDGIVLMLKDGGRLSKGNYLSQFRNAINYRQEHCAWHPYGKNSIKVEKILALTKNWKKIDIPTTSKWKESAEAYNFFYASVAIVNLCHALIDLISKNSEFSNNLFSRWPNKFLRITSANR
jgi:hypothetical protein